MPINPRPAWDPLPIPAAPDPADYTEFQSLAADLLPADEAALDQAGSNLAEVSAATDNGEQAMDLLGLDLAAGADELNAMIAEADGDTLTDELAAASAQDAALEAAAAESALDFGLPY